MLRKTTATRQLISLSNSSKISWLARGSRNRSLCLSWPFLSRIRRVIRLWLAKLTVATKLPVTLIWSNLLYQVVDRKQRSTLPAKWITFPAGHTPRELVRQMLSRTSMAATLPAPVLWDSTTCQKLRHCSIRAQWEQLLKWSLRQSLKMRTEPHQERRS